MAQWIKTKHKIDKIRSIYYESGHYFGVKFNFGYKRKYLLGIHRKSPRITQILTNLSIRSF
jgi:hypothetical protein